MGVVVKKWISEYKQGGEVCVNIYTPAHKFVTTRMSSWKCTETKGTDKTLLDSSYMEPNIFDMATRQKMIRIYRKLNDMRETSFQDFYHTDFNLMLFHLYT